jgi:hypothetical protein
MQDIVHEQCPVCWDHVALASLMAGGRTRNNPATTCGHKLCINCAVRIGNGTQRCPTCSTPFNRAIQLETEGPLMNQLKYEYDVEHRSLFPGILDIKGSDMGIAGKLRFESCTDRSGVSNGRIKVFIPEFLYNMPGSPSPVVRFTNGLNHNGDPHLFELTRTAVLDSLRTEVLGIQHLPIIFTRITIAKRIIEMAENYGVFDIKAWPPGVNVYASNEVLLLLI